MSVARVESLEGLSSTTCGERSDPQPTNDKEVPNKTEPRKKRQLQGGFECVFVEEPPKQVQTECAICLCVLKDPYLVDCCCNSFCQSCIKPIQDDDKPCPLCSTKFTTCIPEKRLQRTLNEMKVYCPQKELGCEWIGELISLPQHLNTADESKQLVGCSFAVIECTFCGDNIQRKDLKEHKTHICPLRPYSCNYCNDYESTFEEVTTNHWPICPSRPVLCPNECGASPKLASLDDHIENECPLQVVTCAFQYAGCNERLTRRDMADHISQSLALHMSLQATSHQQELKKLNTRLRQLEMQLDKATELQNQSTAQITKLQMENELLQERLEQDYKKKVASVRQEIITKQDQRLRGHLVTLRGEIKRAQNETEKDMCDRFKQMEKQMAIAHEDVCNHVGLVPFNFTMPKFEQKKESKSAWFGPSFYTHPHGYKICVKIYANGWDDGENSHVGVALYMMRGEFDECLKWPFRGDITIQLLNQTFNIHHSLVLKVTDNAGDDVLDRVTRGERSLEGFGFDQFIRHRDLHPNYVKNNCLKLRIQEVKLKI